VSEDVKVSFIKAASIIVKKNRDNDLAKKCYFRYLFVQLLYFSRFFVPYYPFSLEFLKHN